MTLEPSSAEGCLVICAQAEVLTGSAEVAGTGGWGKRDRI